MCDASVSRCVSYTDHPVSTCTGMLCCYKHEGMIVDGNLKSFFTCSKALGSLITTGCPSKLSDVTMNLQTRTEGCATIKQSARETAASAPSADAVRAALCDKYSECTLLFCGVIGDSPSEHREAVSGRTMSLSLRACVCASPHAMCYRAQNPLLWSGKSRSTGEEVVIKLVPRSSGECKRLVKLAKDTRLHVVTPLEVVYGVSPGWDAIVMRKMKTLRELVGRRQPLGALLRVFDTLMEVTCASA